MYNTMGNVPNLKNSNTIDQSEIQKAKNNMSNYSQGTNMMSNMSSGTNMTSSTMGMAYGSSTNLSNSNNIDQLEVQQAREKVQNSGIQNTIY
ncbi:hypothetical protein [Inediibacterium massiliense]|uniref:hypothetical protein n=1 Tax=Inediibacterium massiliense TaxID=1658111 RepID=UPI0006B50D31|nr:hypothetical protein [Inediibacterium massiliense]